MKNLKNIILCLGIIILMNSTAWTLDVKDAYMSWFTDATSDEFTAYDYTSDVIDRPSTDFPTSIESASYGTRGNGADISTSLNFSSATFSVDSLTDMAANGSISFWICPQEDGELSSGGAEHYILQGGSSDLSSDGFLISWDNRPGYGLISFTMVGKKTIGGNSKRTSCQYAISGWTAGEWHHVVAAWVQRSLGDTSKALVLFIDRTEVVSVVFGGEAFMDYSGTNVTIGGGTAHDSGCYIDGLIFRKNVSPDCGSHYAVNKIAYRDFFLTAPYTSVKITHQPFGASDPYAASPGAVRSLPADPWILLDKHKQFGLLGTRKLNAAGTEKVTEYLTCFEDNPDRDWGEWAGYDAKPIITWELYDINNGASLVNVDVNGHDIPTGLVKGDVGDTQPYLIATFRQPYSAGRLVHSIQTSVRTWDGVDAKPDLGIMHVSRGSRYDRNSEVKQWPAPGETVVFTVHFGNFGTATALADSYHIKFESAVDTNNNFRLDDDEIWTPMAPEIIDTPEVPPGAYYDGDNLDLCKWIYWQWPYSAQDPTGLNSASRWIRVTLDSADELTEICESNNVRTEKTNARSFRMGYHKRSDPARSEDYKDIGVDDDYDNRVINMVGSFSDFDWYYSHLERVNIMLQTTKYPTVSAVGIQEGLRMDDFYCWAWDDPEPFPHHISQGDARMFDGSYSDIRIYNDDELRYLSLYIGECHELGHTVLRLPDLYNVRQLSAYNVLSGVTPGSAEFPAFIHANCMYWMD